MNRVHRVHRVHYDADAILGVVAVYAGARIGELRPDARLLVMVAVIAVALRRWAAVVAVSCVLFVTAAVLMTRALAGVERAPAIAPTAAVELVGDPTTRRFTTTAIGRVHGHRVLLAAGGTNGSRLAVLTAGDVMSMTGRAQPLTRYERRYRWQHVVARVSVRDFTAVHASHSLLARASNGVRGWVLSGADALPAPESALDAGFLLGDTRAITPRVDNEFRRAGLSHLLAVSGANVAFVLGLASPILRRSSLARRFVIGAMVLVLFGAVTRWQPSVVRAVAMALVALAAQWLGRPVSALRLLCIAAGALMLVDPFLVHSVGFGLSCGACAGIALLARPLARRLRGPGWMREAGAVTLAAQVGVAPVLLPVFGTLPLVALPANLLAAPAVGPLTVGGLIGGVLGGAVRGRSPALARAVQLPVIVLVRYVATVASSAARFSLALGPRDLLLGVACAAAVTAVMVTVRYARSS